MILKKWNYETHKYDDTEIPDKWNVSLYEIEMDTKINCPHCGKEFDYGDGYTSLEFHNWVGLGFSVCEECYEKEWERRRKYRGNK